jgi:outer membrane protein OmpA-like peptidoglycan-associated protein
MSLSRALAIRSFLIENGVRSTRIDVRALGNKTTEEPFNRVDLKVTER